MVMAATHYHPADIIREIIARHEPQVHVFMSPAAVS